MLIFYFVLHCTSLIVRMSWSVRSVVSEPNFHMQNKIPNQKLKRDSRNPFDPKTSLHKLDNCSKNE